MASPASLMPVPTALPTLLPTKAPIAPPMRAPPTAPTTGMGTKLPTGAPIWAPTIPPATAPPPSVAAEYVAEATFCPVDHSGWYFESSSHWPMKESYRVRPAPTTPSALPPTLAQVGGRPRLGLVVRLRP